ncbi:MAG: threonine/serine exporter family protein [Mobilicoccus sp.]|nr:threonine/serine exporter family protein [Mobilicoccus sp.]
MSDGDTLRLLAYLTAALVATGAPVHEVEADMRRLATRLGHPHAQIDAGPTGVVLALDSGSPATFETVEGSLRLDQSAETAAIRIGLESGTLSVTSALEQLSRLRATPHRYARGGLEVGMACVAGGIALILQPLWASVAFAVIVSPVTAGLVRLSGRWRSLATLTPFLAAFLIALLAFTAADLGWIEGPLRSLLPPIAVLLPGALVVTGLAELAAGAMTAGTARLVYGGAQLFLFALGVTGAALLLSVGPQGLQTEMVNEIGPWSPFVGAALLTVGISLMESVPVRLVPWIFLILCVTLVFQVGGHALLAAPWLGALLGATASSFGAALVEIYRPTLPRLVMFLPSFWLLVPGSLGLVSLTQLSLSPGLAVQTIGHAASVVAAIALGLIVGTTAARTVGLIRGHRLELLRRRREAREVGRRRS